MLPKFLILPIVLVLIIVSGFIIYSQFANKNTIQSPLGSQREKTVLLPKEEPSSTPTPFDDVTIPFLREKKYESSLERLEKVSENSSYTSYLTSYTSDGLKINGLLTEPKIEKPQGGFPAIVFIHGYIPPKNYQTLGAQYSSYVDFLARNGFVVFKIDLRGHGASEGEAGGAYYSSDYVIDALSAHTALQSSDFINPEKIGLWGHSMAGNVVMRSLAAKPDIPAIVIWAGAVYTYLDFSEFGIDDNSYQPPDMNSVRVKKRRLMLETFGEPKDGNPFWQKVAPTNYLNDIKGAIQIHHAINDDVVSIDYSRNLNSILDKTSIIHQLQEYPSGGHNIAGSSFTQAMQKTTDFFKEHLK